MTERRAPYLAGRPRQRSLFTKRAVIVRNTEEMTQRAIVQALRAYGWTVLITSQHRRRCAGCGAWQSGGFGVSAGVPDLLVWREGQDGWIGLEIKRPVGGQLSTAQKLLRDAGAIHIVRSAEEALHAVGQET